MLADLFEVFEAEDAGLVAVGEIEVEGVTPDDRDLPKGEIV